jgi:hypothetical protein
MIRPRDQESIVGEPESIPDPAPRSIQGSTQPTTASQTRPLSHWYSLTRHPSNDGLCHTHVQEYDKLSRTSILLCLYFSVRNLSEDTPIVSTPGHVWTIRTQGVGQSLCGWLPRSGPSALRSPSLQDQPCLPSPVAPVSSRVIRAPIPDLPAWRTQLPPSPKELACSPTVPAPSHHRNRTS